MHLLKDKYTAEQLLALGALPPVLALDAPDPSDEWVLPLADAAPSDLSSVPHGGGIEAVPDEFWKDLMHPLEAIDMFGRSIRIRFDGFPHDPHRQSACLDCHHDHSDSMQCHKYQFLWRHGG